MGIHSDMTVIRQSIVDQIPAEAVRHGWNVGSLSYGPDDFGAYVWSVELFGPLGVDEDTHRFVGQETPAFTWRVHSGSHGIIHAADPMTLGVEVDRWLRAVGVKPAA